MRKDRDLLVPAAKFSYTLSYATDSSRLIQIGSASVCRLLQTLVAFYWQSLIIYIYVYTYVHMSSILFLRPLMHFSNTRTCSCVTRAQNRWWAHAHWGGPQPWLSWYLSCSDVHQSRAFQGRALRLLQLCSDVSPVTVQHQQCLAWWGWSWRWQTLESSCPDWSEPVWHCVPFALADAAPAVHVGRGVSLMHVVPLPRCTVTWVVTVVSLPRVLGVPAVKPAVRLWAFGAAWVRTLFEVITEMVAVRAVRGLSNLISPVQFFGRPWNSLFKFRQRVEKAKIFRQNFACRANVRRVMLEFTVLKDELCHSMHTLRLMRMESWLKMR